jgi:hypothetical protein
VIGIHRSWVRKYDEVKEHYLPRLAFWFPVDLRFDNLFSILEHLFLCLGQLTPHRSQNEENKLTN